MTKKKVRRPVSLSDRAHRFASRRAPANVEQTWTPGEQGTYWWGLFEGYQAGILAERRKK